VLTSRIGPDGAVRLEGATRALIESRAKLAYETAREEDLPAGFADLAARIEAAEERRGAARVNPPEQEVTRDAAGHFALRFRPQLPAEERNAALSLATNLAVADALLAARTGLFRVMAAPDAGAEVRLRRTALAFHLDWPEAMPLAVFEKGLRPAVPPEAAFMLATRRAGRGASYVPWRAGEVPWHAAMAATYAHCTAPLRRLADRYVLEAVLAVVDGQNVPDAVTEAFARLPATMARAEARDGQIDRAAVDLAEVALLANHEGEVFRAVITDIGESGARIQLTDLPIVARTAAPGLLPGAAIAVRLVSADVAQRRLVFEQAG
jgi:exoribonuclease R